MHIHASVCWCTDACMISYETGKESMTSKRKNRKYYILKGGQFGGRETGMQWRAEKMEAAVREG